MEIRLKYIGRGSALYDVPARDLTDEDFTERKELWKELGVTEATLIKSGLYEKAEKKDKSAKDGK